MTAFFCLEPSIAHQTLASISGSVADNSGGAVVGATVTIVNDQTSLTRTTASGASGLCLFKDLSVGTWSFTVSAPNYSTAKIVSIALQADRTATVSITLKPRPLIPDPWARFPGRLFTRSLPYPRFPQPTRRS